ncbi:MAG: flagellar basal body rod protein [Rhizobacter sp.]
MATKAAAAPPAAPQAEEAVPAKKGKKKLIIILAAVVLVLAAAGGGAAIFLKKKAAAAAELADADTDEHVEQSSSKPKVDLNQPPVFVPLDPFTVNLADKESDRYAQIAVTLQVENAQFAEKMKALMPAIRNSILMVLAHKTSQELLERSGKEALAQEIMREAARPMGIYIPDVSPSETKAAQESNEETEGKGKGKSKKAKPASEAAANPIQQVHFANFIIQ